MKPVRNNILTKPFPPDEISEGGILVPESARKENNKMFVIAVGRGTKERKMIFNPGDIVYRVKDWGTPIDIDGERHYIMDQNGIIAKE
jgi:chaperonin GroES